MKLPNIRKRFAILVVLLTGGIGIGLIGLVPETAEAAFTQN
jgi:hypothetical protein